MGEGFTSREEKKRQDDAGGRRSTDPLSSITRLSQQSLDQLEDALASRKKLTQRFLKEIEKEIAEALKMLRLLGSPWKHGDRTEYEFMRIALDKALTARKKERRERLLQAWKDLLELRQKRIELLRELTALGMVAGDEADE